MEPYTPHNADSYSINIHNINNSSNTFNMVPYIPHMNEIHSIENLPQNTNTNTNKPKLARSDSIGSDVMSDFDFSASDGGDENEGGRANRYSEVGDKEADPAENMADFGEYFSRKIQLDTGGGDALMTDKLHAPLPQAHHHHTNHNKVDHVASADDDHMSFDDNASYGFTDSGSDDA